jgi:hypothetical protein
MTAVIRLGAVGWAAAGAGSAAERLAGGEGAHATSTRVLVNPTTPIRTHVPMVSSL